MDSWHFAVKICREHSGGKKNIEKKTREDTTQLIAFNRIRGGALVRTPQEGIHFGRISTSSPHKNQMAFRRGRLGMTRRR